MNTAKRPKPATLSIAKPRAPRATRTVAATEPAASTRRARRVTTPAVPTPPSAEIIAIRAYQIFEARGGAPGDALADWLQAEAELTAPRTPARRKKPAARAASA